MALGFLVIDHLFPIELIYTNSVILHTNYNFFSTLAFAEKTSLLFQWRATFLFVLGKKIIAEIHHLGKNSHCNKFEAMRKKALEGRRYLKQHFDQHSELLVSHERTLDSAAFSARASAAALSFTGSYQPPV